MDRQYLHGTPGQRHQGWDEGQLGVKAGGRVQIDVPADKGYGENPTGGQPGDALRFVVYVLSVV